MSGAINDKIRHMFTTERKISKETCDIKILRIVLKRKTDEYVTRRIHKYKIEHGD